MSRSGTDRRRAGPPPIPQRTCEDCGARVAVILWPRGGFTPLDIPPRFDPAQGWFCKPHRCTLMADRLARERMRRAAGPSPYGTIADSIRASIGDGITEEEGAELLEAAARGELVLAVRPPPGRGAIGGSWRRRDEGLIIEIGDDLVAVDVVDIRGDAVRLGVAAPVEMPVHRGETLDEKG